MITCSCTSYVLGDAGRQHPLGLKGQGELEAGASSDMGHDTVVRVSLFC